MFITVDGFNKTGIPSALWDFMEPYARIDSAAGTAVLALVILFLSNVASNVPTGKSASLFKDFKVCPPLLRTSLGAPIRQFVAISRIFSVCVHVVSNYKLGTSI